MSPRIGAARIAVALWGLCFVVGSGFDARRAEGAVPTSGDPCEGFLSSCIDSETFWPYAGPGTFATIASSTTTPAKRFAVGLVSSYQSKPILVSVPQSNGESDTSAVVRRQLTTTAAVAYGVTSDFQLHLALPFTLHQSGDGLSRLVDTKEPLKSSTIRDLRFGFTYNLLAPSLPKPATGTTTTTATPGNPTPPAAEDPSDVSTTSMALRFEFTAPTGDKNGFGGSKGVVFAPSLLGEMRSGSLVGAVELGARLRQPTDLVGTRIGSQAVVGVGLGLDVFSDNPKILGLGVELRALPVLVGQNVLQLNAKGDVESRPTDGVLVPAEWLVSAHSGLLMDGALDVQAGVGSALPLSGAIPMTVPGVRMVLGLRYIPTNKPKKVPPPPPPVPAKAPEPDVEKPSPLSPFGQGPVQAIDQTPVGPSAASGGHPTPPPPPTGSTTIPWLPSDKKPIPTETLSETKDGNRDGVSGGGKKKPGQLNLATPTGRSHRIFVDGRLVNGKGQLLIPLSCGKHLVKVGRTGKPKEIDVPCGGEVMLE